VLSRVVVTGDDGRTKRSRAVLMSVKWNVVTKRIFNCVTIANRFHVSKIRRILRNKWMKCVTFYRFQ